MALVVAKIFTVENNSYKFASLKTGFFFKYFDQKNKAVKIQFKSFFQPDLLFYFEKEESHQMKNFQSKLFFWIHWLKKG